ncbi:MAG: aminotransferase class I/II-fold pyridoxal phosphate-dependent enzyme [Acidimicrobiia bacterium]|nr:aminotransferase class I/II-fold pyridoxal phosphate-dependent enzyme [Acidimicrobiia bacterium]
MTQLTRDALATDSGRLATLFGDNPDLLPLWIAEPYVDLSPAVTAAMRDRADIGWYGYESRSPRLERAFWNWMQSRHGWDGSDLRTSVSPSVGTSIGVLLEQHTAPGDGVILQPPVFTDFKPLVVAAERTVIRSPLRLTDTGYEMDLADLEAKAAEPTTTAMILCNPHNPVGRVWTAADLKRVAEICAANNVFVIADEIHADLTLPPSTFSPFARAATDVSAKWAATHGPIKTFGLAGVCDTLLITDDEAVSEGFRRTSSRLHLTRNNVFAMAAFETAYRSGGGWLDRLLELIGTNVAVLADGLPEPITLVRPQATYLAWLDFRGLELEVPELARWLAAAGLALSPGHWFGRAGAGFARMTIAAPTPRIEEAIDRLHSALN